MRRMAAPVQKALSLLAGLRSRRRRVAGFVLLGWLLLAQTLLIAHRIDHSRAEHGVTCTLCVAADHSAAPSQQTVVTLPRVQPDSVVASVPQPTAALVVLPYRSRAPPAEHHRA